MPLPASGLAAADAARGRWRRHRQRFLSGAGRVGARVIAADRGRPRRRRFAPAPAAAGPGKAGAVAGAGARVAAVVGSPVDLLARFGELLARNAAAAVERVPDFGREGA